MNKLREFYVYWMTSITIGLVIVASLYTFAAEPWIVAKYGATSFITQLASGVTSRPVIALIVFLFDQLLRKKAWRWVYPQFDFSGKWRGQTVYAEVHVGKAEVPKDIDQEVTIEQDCLSIHLRPSPGENFTFSSIAIDIDDKAKALSYAYHVKYLAAEKNRPREAHGFEELEAIGHDQKKRPLRLTGWFAHCARGQSPVLSGNVFLERVV